MSQIQIQNLDYIVKESVTNCHGCGYSVPQVSIAYGVGQDTAYGTGYFSSISYFGGVAGGSAAASAAAATGAAVSVGGIASVLVSTFAYSFPSN